MTIVLRRLAVVALASALLPDGGPRAADAQTERSGLVETAVVRRVTWPVRFEPQRPGGCDTIAAADVEVEEDGRVLPVEALERHRTRMLHALVIDASLSMDTRLERIRRAAKRYVAALPPDSSVMLASYADNLELHVPPTASRDRIFAALDALHVRWGTAYQDALYYSLRYLGSLPGRKVVVLFTDGCDRTSTGIAYGTGLAELAERSEVTVFPVGVDVPASCDEIPVNAGAGLNPTVELRRLARRTGGRLFKTSNAAALGDVFGVIASRLAREGYVVYRPGPRREEASPRVRVRSRVPQACRVTSAGPRSRAPAQRSNDPDLLAIGSTIEFGDWWPRSVEPARLELGTLEVRGRASDLVSERSLLYSKNDYWGAGRFRSSPDRRVRAESRDFRLGVPEFDTVRGAIDSPESLLLYLLYRDRGAFSRPRPGSRGGPAPRRPNATWLHGQTLLELREQLGQALYAYPGYRAFVLDGLREEYRAEMLEVLERWELPAVQRAELRRAIESSAPRPRARDPQRFLAEWLGDITAHDLTRRFEAWLANLLLAGEWPAERLQRVLELVDRRWPELRDWFPPPTRVRIVAPLVPVYDPDRDRLGFYRIVLPRVHPDGPPPDPVSPRPLALTFARLLHELNGGTPSAVRVESPDYHHPRKRPRRRLVRDLKRAELLDDEISWRRVPMVGLVLRDDDPGELRLVGVFDPESLVAGDVRPRLVCVDVEAGERPALAARLRERLAPCRAERR